MRRRAGSRLRRSCSWSRAPTPGRRSPARSRRAAAGRPIGVSCAEARHGLGRPSATFSGVHTGPGATAFTRMPRGDEVPRQRLGEGVDRALGRGVVEQVPAAFQAGDRSDVDDRRAASQVGQRRPAPGRSRRRRWCGRCDPTARRRCRRSTRGAADRRRCSPGRRAGRSGAPCRARPGRSTRGPCRSPGSSRHRCPSWSPASAVVSASRLLDRQVADGDRGALAGEQHARGPADAGIAAGHDRDLAAEPSPIRAPARADSPASAHPCTGGTARDCCWGGNGGTIGIARLRDTY